MQKAVTMTQAIARTGAAPDSRRMAATILEVLAGVMRTTDAAKALSVSLPRYYALEARAIEGLIRACEPRKRGKGRSPAKEVARLEKEVKRLENECSRQTALTRAARRTLSLPPPAAAPAKKMSDPQGKPPAKGPRTRRAVARALIAATALKKDGALPPAGKPPEEASQAPPRGTP
jgi:hypothetical protein